MKSLFGGFGPDLSDQSLGEQIVQTIAATKSLLQRVERLELTTSELRDRIRARPESPSWPN